MSRLQLDLARRIREERFGDDAALLANVWEVPPLTETTNEACVEIRRRFVPLTAASPELFVTGQGHDSNTSSLNLNGLFPPMPNNIDKESSSGS